MCRDDGLLNNISFTINLRLYPPQSLGIRRPDGTLSRKLNIKQRFSNGNTRLHDGTHPGEAVTVAIITKKSILHIFWQVIVKYAEVPVKPKPPMPTDSVADTMYFINMMREEGEEARRKARDELILRKAMEQKSRQREVSKSYYLRL